MKSIVKVAAVGAAGTLSVGLMPAVASADTEGCVTLREYRKVEKGWTGSHVHRVFDTRGEQVLVDIDGAHHRFYDPCGDNVAYYAVKYKNKQAVGKYKLPVVS